jgi:translation initiation factor 2B subunit (eIF-2B alpha/beta/delta family)
METIDILENKIKEALSKKASLEAERRILMEEVTALRESIRRLEAERREVKSKLDQIIEKIELYLSRSEA